jgi:small-conductance mechanosensitive channel
VYKVINEIRIFMDNQLLYIYICWLKGKIVLKYLNCFWTKIHTKSANTQFYVLVYWRLLDVHMYQLTLWWFYYILGAMFLFSVILNSCIKLSTKFVSSWTTIIISRGIWMTYHCVCRQWIASIIAHCDELILVEMSQCI